MFLKKHKEVAKWPIRLLRGSSLDKAVSNNSFLLVKRLYLKIIIFTVGWESFFYSLILSLLIIFFTLSSAIKIYITYLVWRKSVVYSFALTIQMSDVYVSNRFILNLFHHHHHHHHHQGNKKKKLPGNLILIFLGNNSNRNQCNDWQNPTIFVCFRRGKAWA